MKDYITGPSTKPFVLYGAGGSGKSALLSKTALMSIKEWLQVNTELSLVNTPNTELSLVNTHNTVFSLVNALNTVFSLAPALCAAPHVSILRHHTQLHRPGAAAQVHLPANILHIHAAF